MPGTLLMAMVGPTAGRWYIVVSEAVGGGARWGCEAELGRGGLRIG